MLSHFLSTEMLKLLSHIPPAFWWWLWVILYAGGTILTLWVLSLVKNVTGWTGVVVLALILTYSYGYARGGLHVSYWPWQNPIPHFEVPR